MEITLNEAIGGSNSCINKLLFGKESWHLMVMSYTQSILRLLILMLCAFVSIREQIMTGKVVALLVVISTNRRWQQ